MNIQHEILSFDENIGGVLVRYFTDSNPTGYIYNIDVPMIDGEYVSEIELNTHIEHLAPKSQLQRVEEIKTAKLPAYLSSIVAKQEQQQVEQTQNYNDVIKQLVVTVLQEEGLIA